MIHSFETFLITCQREVGCVFNFSLFFMQRYHMTSEDFNIAHIIWTINILLQSFFVLKELASVNHQCTLLVWKTEAWTWLRVSKWWQNFHFWINYSCQMKSATFGWRFWTFGWSEACGHCTTKLFNSFTLQMLLLLSKSFYLYPFVYINLCWFAFLDAFSCSLNGH